MKRILLYSSGIIAERKPTGGELRFLELASYLKGMENAELCCADGDAELEAFGLHADLHMNGPEGTPAFLPGEARILLANRKNLKKIAEKGYSDVVVFDVPPAIGLTLSGVGNLVLMIRKDLIGYERVKSAGSGVKKQLRIAYQWCCESICLRNAKQVICQCDYDRDVILNRHPLRRKNLASKFTIQINNCNPEWIVKHAAETETGTEAGPRKDNRFRFCFIGGFDDLRKGQELFLRAAEELAAKYPEAEFFIIGGGKQLEACRKRYETDRIRFFGRMENPLSVLKKCDLLAVPSLADSCPNTVMEALYAGIPVIGSRAGGIPEILADEEALFSPEWKSLEEKMEVCFKNPAFLERLRNVQAERKKELSFDWASRIVELIEKNTRQE